MKSDAFWELVQHFISPERFSWIWKRTFAEGGATRFVCLDAAVGKWNLYKVDIVSSDKGCTSRVELYEDKEPRLVFVVYSGLKAKVLSIHAGAEELVMKTLKHDGPEEDFTRQEINGVITKLPISMLL